MQIVKTTTRIESHGRTETPVQGTTGTGIPTFALGVVTQKRSIIDIGTVFGTGFQADPILAQSGVETLFNKNDLRRGW